MRRLALLALLALAAVAFGGLPVTGLQLLQLGLLVIALLLVGARLRVRALRRKRPSHLPLDDDFAEPIVARRAHRDEWSFPDPDETAPTGILPSTATARRRARAAAVASERH
jgi:hypothetical protein